MVAHRDPAVEVAAYLEAERHSAVKHEYVDGHVYAMSGGSTNHGAIGANVIALLRDHVRGGPCRVYSSDVRVRLSPTRYLYPDVSVSCDERDRGDLDAVQHPVLVVEVLSPTTEAYDRGDKFAYYRGASSLREYVLVSARQPAVECYRRGPDNLWTLHPFGPGDTLALESVGLRCPVAALYEDVALPDADGPRDGP